eukprot:snap_masked-scaffold_9-processed-gene-12.32-mRNA-1 protein AED:1.00 eAED:1.00 QI:0/0/0/0/1/1/2/0/236
MSVCRICLKKTSDENECPGCFKLVPQTQTKLLKDYNDLPETEAMSGLITVHFKLAPRFGPKIFTLRVSPEENIKHLKFLMLQQVSSSIPIKNFSLVLPLETGALILSTQISHPGKLNHGVKDGKMTLCDIFEQEQSEVFLLLIEIGYFTGGQDLNVFFKNMLLEELAACQVINSRNQSDLMHKVQKYHWNRQPRCFKKKILDDKFQKELLRVYVQKDISFKNKNKIFSVLTEKKKY